MDRDCRNQPPWRCACPFQSAIVVEGRLQLSIGVEQDDVLKKRGRRVVRSVEPYLRRLHMRASDYIAQRTADVSQRCCSGICTYIQSSADARILR